MKKCSANDDSGLFSDSDVNGELETLKSKDEALVGSLDPGGDGDHKSVPLVSDSSKLESTRKRSSHKNVRGIKNKSKYHRENFDTAQFVRILKGYRIKIIPTSTLIPYHQDDYNSTEEDKPDLVDIDSRNPLTR